MSAMVLWVQNLHRASHCHLRVFDSPSIQVNGEFNTNISKAELVQESSNKGVSGLFFPLLEWAMQLVEQFVETSRTHMSFYSPFQNVESKISSGNV